MGDIKDYLRTGEAPEQKIFVKPSKEAECLMRHMPWLVSPKEGQGTWLSKTVRSILVAPYSQLTLISFDLNAYLYEIFHQTKVARTGHFIFMIFVNFFWIVGLSHVGVQSGNIVISNVFNLGTAFALLLVVWYGFIAKSAGLKEWWFFMLPFVTLLWVAAMNYGSATFLPLEESSFFAPTAWYFNPWMWMAVSSLCIMLSHVPEPKLPPRVVDGAGWKSVVDYLFDIKGLAYPITTVIRRCLWMGSYFFWGTLNEWWASPRLMPYNFLMVMFKYFGYKPELYATLRGYVDEALESGNPAIDYIGIGGKTMMQMPPRN